MNTSNLSIDDHILHRPLRFHITTPMIDDLHNVIKRWLWCGSTGGLVTGNARVGKTHAINDLSKRLETRGGQHIPAICLTISKRDQTTIASVFRNLALKLGLNPSKHATADLISNDIVHLLGEASLCNSCRQIALFVDEFQRLTVNQLGVFVELHDRLTETETNLTVFFVGNTGESDSLLKSIEEDPEHDHIRGRFFIESYPYTGIRKKSDVEACLKAYDSMRYPAENGPTITEFFLPTAYASGWRLHNISDIVWSVYTNSYRKNLNISSWGMRYFSASIRVLLSDLLPTLESMEDEDLIRSCVSESIKVSGLVPGLVRVA